MESIKEARWEKSSKDGSELLSHGVNVGFQDDHEMSRAAGNVFVYSLKDANLALTPK